MKKKITQFKWLAALLLLVAAMVMPSTAWAQIIPSKPSGVGTVDSPYQISNKEELYWFAELVNRSLSSEEGNESACAELTDNIEVSGTWTPIMCYEGTFDGQGHTISGLRNVEASYCLGLFGVTNNNSVIRNVGIVNCEFSVTTGNSVGGVCGENNGTIENCYTTGSTGSTSSITSGSGSHGGGVCGLNNGTIKNCYNTGTVDGAPGAVGGVCGTNNGTIKNCYNTGSVSKGSINGGVCGHNDVTITNCYYLSGTATGGIYENFGTGSAEVKTADKFNRGEVAWLLNGSTSAGNSLAWYQNIDNGTADSYPLLDSSHGKVYRGYKCLELTYSNNQAELSENPVHHYNNGICKACKAYQPATLTTDKYDINGDSTKDNVYEIGNAGQLYWFAGLVNGTLRGVVQNQSACAVLTQDITVNSGVLQSDGSLAGNASGFTAWTPIGTQENPYSGTFDGNGHTISGLYFNDKNKAYVGLFGKSNGTIKNVGVVNSYFYGYCIVGAVCGENNGTIQNCYNNSTINGTKSIGGICGIIDGQGKILNCYNVSKVIGSENIGGVCGKNNNGTITNCYNNSTVRGTEHIGGICGIIESQGKILNCYNVGVISNVNKAGGVCGSNNGGTITNCYYLSGTATGGINGADATGSAEGKSADKFNNGEVTYLLNEGKAFGTQVWGQQLETNDYPVLGSDYKVIRAAQDGQDGTNYWATFSNLDSNAELTAPTGNVTVYNATVSGGTLTLAKRSDNRVAMEEGVLLKAGCEYVNAKNISDQVSAAAIGENDLVATPKDAGVINAETGYTLYRLTYNKTATKEGLGFYLGVVGDIKDGSQLAATPGKAYLKVASEAVTKPSGASIRGFAFPGDGETTDIECISVSDEGLYSNDNAEGIFDLQGRKVSKPTKGVYINNGKKVIIK